MKSSEWENVGRILGYTHDAARGGKRSLQAVRGFEELFAPFREMALEALQPVFAGKCAYTEQPENSEMPLMFHLHRPGGDALGIEGQIAPEHYWWLQDDWKNWVLVTPQITSIKGTYFPVIGDRLRHGGPAKGENALLINPCREHPAWWLEFDDKGNVGSRRTESSVLHDRYPGFDRGEYNIRLLDLNNLDLVEGRRHAISTAAPKKFRHLLRDGDAREVKEWLKGLLAPEQPFLGAVRQRLAHVLVDQLEFLSVDNQVDQVLAMTRLLPHEIAAQLCTEPDRLAELRGRMPLERFEYLLKPVIGVALKTCPDLALLFREPPRRSKKKVAARRHKTVDPKRPEISRRGPEEVVKPPPVRPTSGATIDRSARLRQIRIHNFKAIEDMTITIPDGVETIYVGPLRDQRVRTGAINWKMLLGENACGKSSILQAIAIALFGLEVEETPPLPVAKLRRRDMGKKHSFVELTFRGYERPLRLKLNSNSYRYNWAPDFRLFVRAYGATRLFRSELGDEENNNATHRRRVENLFNPLARVIDVDDWLLKLDEGDFNVAARAIYELIAGFGESADPGRSHVDLVRDVKSKVVTLGGDPLDELCDGYRTLLALTCDIMAGLGSGLSDMENAVGIVLIDEIGAHLHPRLRMQIVGRLRYIFPQIQFICSTHEPLCLRGLFDSEVDRITRVNGTVLRQTINRSPSNYRIDQLLTSEFFGLESTIDPEIDGEFQHYYHLLSLSELTAEQEGERERLRKRLITEGVLGYTRRDQMVYEAIDSYLADRRTKSESAVGRRAAELKQETIDKVTEIWDLAELRQRHRRGGGD